MREDPRSKDLVGMCSSECKLGRMSRPVKPSELNLSAVTLSPRFCIEQGTRADGSVKLRAIDDMTRSGLNAITWASEKLQYEAFDAMLGCIREAHACHGPKLRLWKADVDSAYRRVPVEESSQNDAWIVFMRNNQPVAARHFALPFGSIASVHNWDRIGELLKAIVRQVLHVPVLRFVDDFFGIAAEEDADHMMRVFTRHAHGVSALMMGLGGCVILQVSALLAGQGGDS